MNNNIKGIDTNVGSIEEDKKRLMKSLNYELDKLITSKAETATAVVNLKQPIILMFLSLLSKLEQDEKRIKELEVANKMQEYRINEMDIPKQKVKEILIEIQEEYNKLDKEIDKQIKDKNKDYYKCKENIATMQTLAYCRDNLEELLEESK